MGCRISSLPHAAVYKPAIVHLCTRAASPRTVPHGALALNIFLSIMHDQEHSLAGEQTLSLAEG